MLISWAETVAARRADHDDRLTEAEQAVTDAQGTSKAIKARQRRERLALFAEVFGAERVRRDRVRYELADPHRQVTRWQTAASAAREEAARLHALPPEHAARHVAARRATEAEERDARAERARQMRTPMEQPTIRSKPRRGGPARSF